MSRISLTQNKMNKKKKRRRIKGLFSRSIRFQISQAESIVLNQITKQKQKVITIDLIIGLILRYISMISESTSKNENDFVSKVNNFQEEIIGF